MGFQINPCLTGARRGEYGWASRISRMPTDNMTTLREIFDDRLNEFMPEYTFTEQDEVVRSFAVVGELLAMTFPGQEAALVMTALKRIIGHGPRQEWRWADLDEDGLDQDWRQTWAEIDGWNDSCQPPFLDELHDLNAFANFGVLPIWKFAGDKRLETEVGQVIAARLKAAEDVPAYIEAICSKIDRLEALVSKAEVVGFLGLNRTLTTRDQARARIALDQGKAIKLHDLALLSGVSAKRIQNAIYAKTDEAPLVGKDGLIAPEACEPWLNARDFHWSIWKQVSALAPLSADWGNAVAFEEADNDEMRDDYIFVPVANDGTYFAPFLRRSGGDSRGGFTIGGKGAEQVVSDFNDALALLAKMETPRWRRPNLESGKWGIVSGQTWTRVRRSDLERAS